jgi:glycosyltransferase involved in cell wall biosynthesis
MAELVGYVLSGVEGERAQTNIAYYHRADRLRELAEAQGYESRVLYAKRNASEISAIRRMLRSDWLCERLTESRAVYAAAAEATAIAAWSMRRTKIPVIYDVHTPSVGEKWMAYKMSPSPREFAVYLESCIAELVCIRRADSLLWCSSIQRDYYNRRGFPRDRMHEVRHGVDLERFDAGPMSTGGSRLLVYAGTMRAYQGAELLIEAFEQVKSSGLRLRMIGFTPEESGLRERAESLGIETRPMIPHEGLTEHLRDATATVIVAHPDAVRYKNGAAPTKWPECLALGRPILSVDAYDTRDLIQQLKVGWVVENSVTGIAEGMRKLAAAADLELEEMGRRARNEATKNYGWASVGEKFVTAIRESTKR